MNLRKDYIPTTTPNTFIKCQFYYTKGGMSMFDYKNRPSGYMASVSAVEIEKRDGMIIETYVLYGNGHYWPLLEVPRKSKKSEAQALASYLSEYTTHASTLAATTKLTLVLTKEFFEEAFADSCIEEAP